MTDPLEVEIEQTRERIAANVDALTGKAQTGAKRTVQIVVPVAVVAVVAIVILKRRG